MFWWCDENKNIRVFLSLLLTNWPVTPSSACPSHLRVSRHHQLQPANRKYAFLDDLSRRDCQTFQFSFLNNFRLWILDRSTFDDSFYFSFNKTLEIQIRVWKVLEIGAASSGNAWKIKFQVPSSIHIISDMMIFRPLTKLQKKLNQKSDVFL